MGRVSLQKTGAAPAGAAPAAPPCVIETCGDVPQTQVSWTCFHLIRHRLSFRVTSLFKKNLDRQAT